MPEPTFSDINATSSPSNNLLLNPNTAFKPKDTEAPANETGKKLFRFFTFQSKKSSVAGSIFNLVNTIVGAGILSIPYGVSLNGLILGALLITVMAAISDYAITRLFVKSMVRLEQRNVFAKSVGEVAYATFGNKGVIIADINVTLMQLGACVAYIVILGDVFPGFFPFASKEVVVIVTVILFIIPLALPRSISSLKWGSLLSICFIVAFTSIVIIQMPKGKELSEAMDNVSLATFDFGVFRSLPIVGFAFNCICNVPPIYNELKVRTEKNINKSIHISTAICLVLYTVVGICGYITYTSDTDGDLLVNFGESDNNWVTAVRIAYSGSVILTMPLAMHPARSSVVNLLYKAYPSIPGANKKHLPTRYHVAVTLSLVAFCTVTALVVGKLDLVFGLVGSTCSIIVSYLLPAFILMKLSLPFVTLENGWKGRLEWIQRRAGRFIVLSLGFFIFIVGTIVTLMPADDDDKDIEVGSNSSSGSLGSL
eukprot:TRINITY_DN4425_c0_g1_i1.p1 TRINITY_DN4425_c0_g1~~TRINITY_DN4425_c0_g1_i1.p1  ORF type:complete len:483 (+),score=110.10 TRINITY_DN4425_c0_g1_i1:83-1531(+)